MKMCNKLFCVSTPTLCTFTGVGVGGRKARKLYGKIKLVTPKKAARKLFRVLENERKFMVKRI